MEGLSGANLNICDPTASKCGTLRERSNLRLFLSHCGSNNKQHFDTKMNHVAGSMFYSQVTYFSSQQNVTNVIRMF